MTPAACAAHKGTGRYRRGCVTCEAAMYVNRRLVPVTGPVRRDADQDDSLEREGD